MNTARYKLVWMIASCLAVGVLTLSTNAQSSDQNFPTPVTSNEIVGTIKARDIGDSRLTTYYFAFDGDQGDIFINLVTKNLSGDIDIFTVDGLKPLAKVVVYADTEISETGRLIYLRKPERMLLRIEGRSPGDDPATFRIKFGGSFVALKPTGSDDASKPLATARDEGKVKVNSVGTIISVAPKPVPVREPQKERAETAKAAENTPEKPKGKPSTPTLVISDNTKPAKESAPETAGREKATEPSPQAASARSSKPKDNDAASKPSLKKPEKPAAPEEEKKPDPLANVRLVIQLKDGKTIERRLTEVVKFSVDNGILTVIGKDGNITRYSMLQVGKVTIE